MMVLLHWSTVKSTVVYTAAIAKLGLDDVINKNTSNMTAETDFIDESLSGTGASWELCVYFQLVM